MPDQELLNLYSELGKILHELGNQRYREFHISNRKNLGRLVDAHLFPKDFQFFWDLEIWEIDYSNCVFLELEKPCPAHVSEIYDGYIWDGRNSTDLFGFESENLMLKDLLIVGYTASAFHVFGFDIRQSPYKFEDSLGLGYEEFGFSFTGMLIALFEDMYTPEEPVLFRLKEWCVRARNITKKIL